MNGRIRDLASENVTLRKQIEDILKTQIGNQSVENQGRLNTDDGRSVGNIESVSSKVNIDAIKGKPSEELIELIRQMKQENDQLRGSLYQQEAASEHISHLEEAIEKRDEHHKKLEDK